MSSKDRPSAENSVASPREGGEGETPGQPPDVADLANRIIEKARADLERRLADPVERAKREALHAQGCSTLWDAEEVDQSGEAADGGAVSVLVE